YFILSRNFGIMNCFYLSKDQTLSENTIYFLSRVLGMNNPGYIIHEFIFWNICD
ncbi:unnamed protein product, partial [marine sediment metagenome]